MDANNFHDTLLLMSNPQYLEQAQCHQQKIDSETLLTTENKRFYKKRAIQLFKDLFLNKERKKHTESIKSQFDGFLCLAIQHFQRLDREEILQNEYNSLDAANSVPGQNKCHKTPELSPIQEADEITRTFLMPEMNAPQQATLEGFVIRQLPEETAEIDDEASINRKFPKMREVNLHAEALRTKGVKAKKPKVKN